MNRYISHPDQLYGVRRVCIEEGPAKGTTVLEVHTAGGLQVDVLPDTGLDIGQVRFKGVNVSYLSKNGYDSPARILPYEDEFLRTFPGGMVYTCGLRSAGPANRDGGEWHPLHGRYHGLAAEGVCASLEGENILIKGTQRETALFGHVLELRRTITIPVAGGQIRVQDSITNQTPRDEEFMLLYHCNFGYPLLSEKARLVLPKGCKTTPRTAFAKTGLGGECEFESPVDGEEERVFFHEALDSPRARLENKSLGVAATLTWSAATLPILAQWRSMASGDYVLGLEPTNSYIMGRSAERENGTLPVLRVGETVETELQFTFEEI